MFVTAGNTIVDPSNSAEYKLNFDPDNQVMLKEYAANTTESMSGWVRGQKATITLPANFAAGTYPYLMIGFTKGGNQIQFFFDNIKCTINDTLSN